MHAQQLPSTASARTACLQFRQLFFQSRIAPFQANVLNRHRQSAAAADEYHSFFASSNRSVKNTSMQHHIVRHVQRDDDHRVFTALAFVNRCGIRQAYFIQLIVVVLDYLVVKIDLNLSFLAIYVGNPAKVAVVNTFVIVVA